MSVSFFRESKHILISPVSFLTSLDCHSSMLATIWVTVWTEVAVIDLPSEPLGISSCFFLAWSNKGDPRSSDEAMNPSSQQIRQDCLSR